MQPKKKKKKKKAEVGCGGEVESIIYFLKVWIDSFLNINILLVVIPVCSTPIKSQIYFSPDHYLRPSSSLECISVVKVQCVCHASHQQNQPGNHWPLFSLANSFPKEGKLGWGMNAVSCV